MKRKRQWGQSIYATTALPRSNKMAEQDMKLLKPSLSMTCIISILTGAGKFGCVSFLYVQFEFTSFLKKAIIIAKLRNQPGWLFTMRRLSCGLWESTSGEKCCAIREFIKGNITDLTDPNYFFPSGSSRLISRGYMRVGCSTYICDALEIIYRIEVGVEGYL